MTQPAGAPPRSVAVVTGASSGFGEAIARSLARDGFDLVLGARRFDRIEALSREIGGRAIRLDVADLASVRSFCAQVPSVDLLVNNAGGALGLEPLAESVDEHWDGMWDANVMGLMRMTRELLPKLEASGRGHIVNMGSIAGFEAYRGGAGYNAVKFAVRAISQVLRLELLVKPVRVTEIDPGLSETEFSLVRFAGDTERAAKVYEGTIPLKAPDIAEITAWAVTRPAHCNIDQVVIRPLCQAQAALVYRGDATLGLPHPPEGGARPVAVVTGASSGIGAAAARHLARAGFEVVLGARRLDRIEAIAREIDGRAAVLDVTDEASIRTFAAQVPRANVLVNNAGIAIQRDPVAEMKAGDWTAMWRTNVLGLALVTREFIPKLEASGQGHIINVGSTVSAEVLPGGAGYSSTKHAVRAITGTLRLELHGKPVRVSEVDPGLVGTDFFMQRFTGDPEQAEKAAGYVAGLTPLSGDDVGDAVAFIATRPAHVDIDQLVIKPLAQANSLNVHRVG